MQCPYARWIYLEDVPYKVVNDGDGQCPLWASECADCGIDCWRLAENQSSEKPNDEAASRTGNQLEKDRDYQIHGVLVPVTKGITGKSEPNGNLSVFKTMELPVKKFKVSGLVKLLDHHSNLRLTKTLDVDSSIDNLIEEIRVIIPRLYDAQKLALDLVESNKAVLTVQALLLAFSIPLLIALIVSSIN